jgi:FKBP-type peptidyl-prolyl cis-trans isomerase 2
MTAENNNVVSVNYTLSVKDTGEQVEKTSKEHPFVFFLDTCFSHIIKNRQ